MSPSLRLVVGTAASHLHTLGLETEASQDRAHLIKTASLEAPFCSFLHKDEDSLFVTSELDGETGGVRKLVRKGDRWQEAWYSEASSEGSCHCSAVWHHGRRFVLMANYVGHTVDLLADDGERLQTVKYEGSGPFVGRQESAHCHQVVQNPSTGHIFVCDLGGDYLHEYGLENEPSRSAPRLKLLASFKCTPAQGPRHVAFNQEHPDLLYLVCELSNELVVCRRAGNAAFERIQVISILPSQELHRGQRDDFSQPASAAEIRVSRDGKFVYATTRYLPHEHGDTIFIGRLGADGTVVDCSHHQTNLRAPWHLDFNGDEDLVAVAFQVSNTVVIYKRDSSTGKLEMLATLADIERPSCVLFL